MTRALVLTALIFAAGCARNDSASLAEVGRARAGRLDVVLLSAHDALRHGNDDFTIEFRSSADGTLVDVGVVKGSASMPMAGTPMLGSIGVTRTGVAGRYDAKSELSMVGTWRMTFEWTGSDPGSVTLSRPVQ